MTRAEIRLEGQHLVGFKNTTVRADGLMVVVTKLYLSSPKGKKLQTPDDVLYSVYRHIHHTHST